MQAKFREAAILGSISPSSYPLSQVQPPNPKTGLYLGLAVLVLLIVNSVAVLTIFTLIN